MRLGLRGRHGWLLLIGFTALLVIVERSLQDRLQATGEIARLYGAPLATLLILTIMFVFHQTAKRREATMEAAAAALEAAASRARTVELESLMRFGHALARSLSTEALKETIWQHLPALASDTPVWVVLRTETGWERLTDVGAMRWEAGTLERAADAGVLAHATDIPCAADGIEHDGHVCFPMLSGGQIIGILGICLDQCTLEVRRRLSAAAALLTVAVHNAQKFSEVRDHGMRDGLTGCYNRTHTLDILQAEAARARRTNGPLSVVMFDVDKFKDINDQHGHGGGDAVLAAIGKRLRESLRKSDVRCRYGGDEFLLVLPETGSEGAARVGEWVRGEIERLPISLADQQVAITASVGVATAQSVLESVDSLIDRADRALYQAKAAGRNSVRAAGSSSRSNLRPDGSLHSFPAPATDGSYPRRVEAAPIS